MPPSKHAVLSASGAHRWLHCNPSARLELEFADRRRKPQPKAPLLTLWLSTSSKRR